MHLWPYLGRFWTVPRAPSWSSSRTLRSQALWGIWRCSCVGSSRCLWSSRCSWSPPLLSRQGASGTGLLTWSWNGKYSEQGFDGNWANEIDAFNEKNRATTELHSTTRKTKTRESLIVHSITSHNIGTNTLKARFSGKNGRSTFFRNIEVFR